MMKIVAIKLILLSFLTINLSFANWYTKVDEGMQKAKKEEKLVMFYFYSKGCSYCQQMEYVFGEDDVAKRMENLIVISLDTFSDEGRAWAYKFGVFGVPSYVFYNPKTDKVVSKGFGSMPANSFINFVQNACKLSSIKNC